MRQFLLLLFFGCTGLLSAQFTLTGRVIDVDKQRPITEAVISLRSGEETVASANGDENGRYALTAPDGGRYTLVVSAPGYQTLETPGYLVGSGPAVSVDWELLPSFSVDLEAVTVRSTPTAVNPLVRTVELESVRRIAATFYDPARLLALAPGVVQANDQGNHLSVRGNSPNRNLWRLEGLAIVNPNHTSNAGTITDSPSFTGGGVSALSAQLLDNSSFYAGNLPLEYGNAVGGTFDMRLRAGDNQRNRYQIQAGLIGVDLAVDGPLGEGEYAPGYVFNYRYSFTGLLADLGVDFGGEEIRFQDLSFNVYQKFRRGGKANFFGLYANSRNDFVGPEERDEIEEEKDLFQIDFDGRTYAVGATYDQPIGTGLLSMGAAYSSSKQQRDQLATRPSPFPDPFEAYQILLERNRTNARINYALQIGGNARLKFGAEYLNDETGLAFPFEFTRNETSAGSVSPYLGLEGRSETLRYSLGLRYGLYQDAQFSNRWEPRLRVSYFRGKETLTLAAEAVSSLPVLFIPGQNNAGTQDNLYSYRGELAWRTRTATNATVSLGSFFQFTPDDYLYSTRGGAVVPGNSLLEIPGFLNYAGETQSRSFGLEASYELPVREDEWYYRINGTVFNSQFRRSVDGSSSEEWESGRYDYGFSFRGVTGKEWAGTDKKERKRIYGLNLSLILNGGERRLPLDLDRSREEDRTIYQNGVFFTEQNTVYIRPDLRLYKQKFREKVTTTLALDIQNLAGIGNDAYLYYDSFQDMVVAREQLTLIPVLSYRLEWK